VQPDRFRWYKRRLGHDVRALAAVNLGGVNQKGLTQIDGPGRAGREGHLPVRPYAVQRQVCQPALSCGGEKVRHVGVGADPDARWRVVLAGVIRQP
jgi:hypothetical protein